MPQHFVNLPGAATLPTRQYQLAGQIIDDLIAESATGVVHGPAGTGKTYAVQAALERLRDAVPGPAGFQVTCARWRSRPSRPCGWSRTSCWPR